MSGGSPGASTLFPFGQDFQNFQPHWGTYAVYNSLPNRPGNVLVAGKWENLRVAQIARVAADSGLYICDSTGTAGGGDAVWLLVGPSAGSTDRFAPKYLVGNQANGDPVLPQPAPFQYISDPGDGSGIEAALAAAALSKGDVWIRPGTYDLAAGPVVNPFNVPADVRVYGAGSDVTIISGRTTGDQGVFVLQAGSQLRDLSITVPASSTSVTSTAVVRSIAANNIENVLVAFETDAAGVLRYGFFFEGIADSGVEDAVCAMRNIAIHTHSTTGIADLTACMWIDVNVEEQTQAIVRGDDVKMSGGDVNLVCNGIFFGDTLVCSDFNQYGIWGQPNTNSTLRVDDGFVEAITGSAANSIGIYLQAGGAHAISNIAITAFGTGTGSAFVVDGAGVGSVTLQGVQAVGDLLGIQGGSATNPVNGMTISDCQVQSGGIGILFESPAEGTQTTGSHIHNNTVNVQTIDGVTPLVGIRARGLEHEITGNHVSVQDTVSFLANGIEVFAGKSTCTGNVVNVLGETGIVVDAERVITNGNVVEASPNTNPTRCIWVKTTRVRCVVGDNNCTNANSPYTVAPIQIDSSVGSVGDNTVFNAASGGATPGIQITGDNNTCIGNVCEGSGGTAVDNTGAGNEVAHNITA